MKNFRKLLIGGLVGISLLTMACNPGPSEEQLNTLQETRAAAEAAEKQVNELESEKSALQTELDTKKQELSRVQAEKAHVEKTVMESSDQDEGGME